MTVTNAAKDLVALTADKNMQFALRGVLTRSASLHIRPVVADFHIHVERDPGVFKGAHEFLRGFVRSHQHALAMCDREGSGQTGLSREQMEEQIENNLRKSGWGDRAAAVVIDPELENWVWSDSPHVARLVGWQRDGGELRDWLQNQGFAVAPNGKPAHPREALEATLRATRKPRSSALYQALAEKVGLGRCSDPAFLKLRTVLQKWFAET